MPGERNLWMENIFDKPKVIALIGNTNSGKSNTIYHIIDTMRGKAEFSLYTFGLKYHLPGAQEIWSLEELEDIENSLIIIDEALSLFDLDNRAKKQQIEQTLRLIHHNNNILLVCMLPENCKKFLAAKIDVMIFKKCAMSDFINGSYAKRVAQNYRGPEAGTAVLGIKVDQALIFDGKYTKIDIPYIEKFDSKKGNIPIFKTTSKTKDK